MKEKESLINPIRTDSYLKDRIKRSTKCDITKSNIELGVIKTVENITQSIYFVLIRTY